MTALDDFNPGYFPFGQKKPDWEKEDGQWGNVGTGKDDDVTWLKSSEDKGVPKEVMSLKIDEIIERGAEILQQFEGRTGLFRQYAEVVVALRCKHNKNQTDSNGKVVRDLKGQTAAYKKAVRRMYERAGVPVALQRKVMVAVGYHVRKLTWDVATPQERFLLSIQDPYAPAQSVTPAAPAPNTGEGTGEPREGTEGPQDEGGEGEAPASVARLLNRAEMLLGEATAVIPDAGDAVELLTLIGNIRVHLDLIERNVQSSIDSLSQEGEEDEAQAATA